MAGFVFNIGAFELLEGTTVWDTSVIKARLVPTADGAIDIDADVMTGIGSTQATASAAIDTPVGPTKDDAADHVKYTSNDQGFPAAALAIGACNRMVFYRFDTNDAGSVPIVYCDITPVTPNGGDITVTCPVLGWFYTQQHA